MLNESKYKVAVIGARGYVGNELLQLLAANQYVDVVAVSSRSASGELVSKHLEQYPDKQLHFTKILPESINTIDADVFFLALPNQVASRYVEAIELVNKKALIIDISADYRFDDGWIYGLPELNRKLITKSKRISNPGCYATAAMLSLLPIKDYLSGVPSLFGVSGFSGAGKTPSDKNNPERLRNNFLPYKLTAHMHENEVSHQLGQAVNFMPHVAPHFRGLSMTVNANLNEAFTTSSLQQLYMDYYSNERLVHIVEVIPEVVDVANKAEARLGGFNVDARVHVQTNTDNNRNSNIRFVAVLDNLLKGAASQAIQNMNLALGLPEHTGLDSTL